jgi:hypothetical protein
MLCALQYRPPKRRFDESDEMDPKLAIFFLLIGAIIGLSHLSDDTLTRMRQQFATKRWRAIVPTRRKS